MPRNERTLPSLLPRTMPASVGTSSSSGTGGGDAEQPITAAVGKRARVIVVFARLLFVAASRPGSLMLVSLAFFSWPLRGPARSCWFRSPSFRGRFAARLAHVVIARLLFVAASRPGSLMLLSLAFFSWPL